MLRQNLPRWQRLVNIYRDSIKENQLNAEDRGRILYLAGIRSTPANRTRLRDFLDLNNDLGIRVDDTGPLELDPATPIMAVMPNFKEDVGNLEIRDDISYALSADGTDFDFEAYRRIGGQLLYLYLFQRWWNLLSPEAKNTVALLKTVSPCPPAPALYRTPEQVVANVHWDEVILLVRDEGELYVDNNLGFYAVRSSYFLYCSYGRAVPAGGIGEPGRLLFFNLLGPSEAADPFNALLTLAGQGYMGIGGREFLARTSNMAEAERRLVAARTLLRSQKI